jgi:hypothetical protein
LKDKINETELDNKRRLGESCRSETEGEISVREDSNRFEAFRFFKNSSILVEAEGEAS